MTPIREDRLRAARFYLKSLSCEVQDWVDGEGPATPVDDDIVSLAVEFSRVRADACEAAEARVA